MEIRELEKDFIGTGEVKGFKFHQVLASEKGYIYEVKSSPNMPSYYEVFRRVTTNSVEMTEEGKLRPVKDKVIVAYPKSTRFGLTAWSCANEEHALRVYYDLVENYVPQKREKEEVQEY